MLGKNIGLWTDIHINPHHCPVTIMLITVDYMWQQFVKKQTACIRSSASSKLFLLTNYVFMYFTNFCNAFPSGAE